MAKKNWLKKNIASLVWALLIILVIGLLIYGGTHQWFKISINMFQAAQPLNPTVTDPASIVTISLTPSIICIGESTTGSITSNMPNAVCSIYANANNAGWSLLSNVMLDSSGLFSQTQIISAIGTAQFKVVCYSGGKYGVSNTANLAVTSCCIDHDGDDRYTPSNVEYSGTVYTDECLPNGQAVKEYICVDGIVSSKNWMCDYGEVCIQSRSGGYCHSTVSTTTTTTLPSGGHSGANTPCSLIWNPSALTCNNGYCLYGTCTYIKATLTMPARCGCQ